MPEISDEDRLIQILEQHKALKLWIIGILLEQGIPCQETYGNDEKGDIIIINSSDVLKIQRLLDQMQKRFNPSWNQVAERQQPGTANPHLEIKTQYLYGKEVELMIAQGTIVGVISASKISQPSRLKLEEASIAYVENVPLSEFSKP